MRIDIVSIFPDYLAPLELSLPGKAREKGLLDVAVHDLREWTTDRHRTVDATPYGGGAGMVMKPEPWGAALAQLSAESTPTIIFTTPSGEPFNQSLARELSAEAHLVFACGRYEGIDQRVIEHAASLGRVREISLGDYVLNGGEVAALAVTEAVVRLLPGFMGNPDSLVEESHEDGLLEYPVYTKPASWQGLEVPPVLLSGDHGAVADWRHSQRVRRTARRRPDLLHSSVLDEETSLRLAHLGDAGELMTLQRAWVGGDVARIVGSGAALPAALTESLDDVRTWLGEWSVLVAHRGGRLVAAARARLESADTWDIDRLMIAPDLEGQDLGRSILEGIEALAPSQVRHVTFSPLSPTSEDLRTYKKAGYRASPRPGSAAATVRLRKPRTITD